MPALELPCSGGGGIRRVNSFLFSRCWVTEHIERDISSFLYSNHDGRHLLHESQRLHYPLPVHVDLQS